MADNLLYTDTDSIFTSVPLQNTQVGPELGQMKLEYIGIKGIFLAPKVYAVEDLAGNLIKKIKGLKEESVKDLKMEHFEDLLNANSQLDLVHMKFSKNISKNTLNLSKVMYNLKITENQRAAVYINDKATYTKPFILQE